MAAAGAELDAHTGWLISDSTHRIAPVVTPLFWYHRAVSEEAASTPHRDERITALEAALAAAKAKLASRDLPIETLRI